MVRTLGLDFVRFAGRVHYGDMPAYYAACDALVMPTLEDNWSLVVPEAMAAGKPVLCSVHNGCWPELVHDGENGWVFDPLDRDATARVLLTASRSLRTPPGDGPGLAENRRGLYAAKRRRGHLAACEIAVRHRRGPAR